LCFGCKVEVIHMIYDKDKKDIITKWKAIWKMMSKTDTLLWWNQIVRLEAIKDVNFWRVLEDCQDYRIYKTLYYRWNTIGHPIMIGDVLDWAWKPWNPKNWFKWADSVILKRWEKKREKLENQSIRCINNIYQFMK